MDYLSFTQGTTKQVRPAAAINIEHKKAPDNRGFFYL
jgi:hypothetical protein